ncbi:putative movement protein [Baminivirus]|uniref:putative movement protein n=1 Tax=Baminivirus TaxID=1229324 RepID=UPI00027EDBC6|nr:putative movement protein [Baminivirus]AFR61149.1 putative movement protein [Baminivirus]
MRDLRDFYVPRLRMNEFIRRPIGDGLKESPDLCVLPGYLGRTNQVRLSYPGPTFTRSVTRSCPARSRDPHVIFLGWFGGAGGFTPQHFLSIA